MARIRNITFDSADPPTLAPFWLAATGYEVEFQNPHAAILKDPANMAPRILLLKVPEPRQGKNRVHIDLEAEDREAEVERLVALGATRGETLDEWGIVWTVMHDPEGNVFCVTGQH